MMTCEYDMNFCLLAFFLLQFSVRSRAASIIQKKWRAYVNEKRRYEANYAALKANLEE